MQQITIEGKILIFKTLAISKVVYLFVYQYQIAQSEKIQKYFTWKNVNLKLKHTNLYNEYEK